jgi:hypothetical protein
MEELQGCPSDWDQHQRLDYFKYQLRKKLLVEGKKKACKTKTILEHSYEEINMLKNKLDKLLLLNLNTQNKYDNDINKIKDAIEIAEEIIKPIKDEESKKLIFRSRCKWAEEGEKSNKYFLNLLKDRQAKMVIRKIASNGVTNYKQDEISRAIHQFYRDLYKKQQDIKKINPNDTLFQDLPKLDEDDRRNLSAPITLDELYETLKTCDESASGPDGITYNVYKKLWPIAGKLIFDAWNFSNEIGHTSISQSEAIITLLEKKGKDKSQISNLRPISLSNCDIKICTKAIALRTNPVLQKLLNITQAGYVPGRQVTNNNRLIEEIIERSNESNNEAFLITLDAQKAFDSVDHGYLLDLLSSYNFPQQYISWVNIIYTNLKAKVMVNGFTTEQFAIEQSVKQGDALSCALFVLAVEPLLRQIERDPEIDATPIVRINNVDLKVKTIAYADDITCIIRNVEGIQKIIDTYSNFSDYSGIKLNVSKTEILVVGKRDDLVRRFVVKYRGSELILHDQDQVTICGICFSNDKNLAHRKNVDDKIIKMERQLNIWRQRNLTLEGKILIVKTFGLSQLTYSMQSTYFTNDDLKHIDNLIFRFLWNAKERMVHKIKKNILMANKSEGGLQAPNIEANYMAIVYKSVMNFANVNHPVFYLYKDELESNGFDFKSYYSNGTNRSTYVTCAIKVHAIIGKRIKKDIEDFENSSDGIHKCYFSFMQNLNIMKTQATNTNQQAMLQRLLVNGIDTVGKLNREKLNMRYNFLFLDVHQIFHTIPISWRKLLQKMNRNHSISDLVYAGTNRWIEPKKITLKDVKKSIIKGESNNFQTYLVHKHPQLVATLKNPFTALHRDIKDVKLKNIQYKILHNIYPTRKHLKKWKLADSENCTMCNEPETLKHAIFDCPVAAKAIFDVKSLLENKLQIHLTFEYESVLLGVNSSTVGLPVRVGSIVDTCLILVKQKLILQRDDKPFLSNEVVEHLVTERARLENINAIRYKKNNANKIWLKLRAF